MNSSVPIELDNFFKRLCDEEEYEPVEGRWIFRSGGSCSRCTDAAMKIAREFGGRVVGYFSSSNPTASIGQDIASGHDFAFIGERYIADYWAFRVAGIIDRPVFDLENPVDREQSKILYGDQHYWETVQFDDEVLMD